jgi:hypothetical protein
MAHGFSVLGKWTKSSLGGYPMALASLYKWIEKAAGKEI